MIDPNKVILMNRIAMYEKGPGKKDIHMNRSKQSTYVSFKVLESMICITLGYAMGAGLYCMRYFSSIITDGVMAYKSAAIKLLMVYVIVMAASLIFTCVFYTDKYRRAHRRILKYDKDLMRLEKYLTESASMPVGEETEETDKEKEEIRL